MSDVSIPSRSRAPLWAAPLVAAALAGIVWLASERSPAQAQQPAASLTVEGTEFVLKMADGRVLRSKDLVGATLTIGQGDQRLPLRIDAVELDDAEASAGKIWLHRFMTRDAQGQWSNLCVADAQGKQLGFPLADAHGGYSITCTAGAEAKCARFGYRPWERAADGSSMAATHRACMNMVRADYCGDDRPMTLDGTSIDLYDRWDIQKSDSREDKAYAFEAAWGVDGALCVAHPRIAENVSLPQIEQMCPRLKGKVGPEACTEEKMRALPGALMFNRSKPVR
jgi:hypothetical protein